MEDNQIKARIGVSSLMPLVRFQGELSRRGLEVLEVLKDPSDHPFAGYILFVISPKMTALGFRRLVSDAKIAALSHLMPEPDPVAVAA